MNKQIKLFFILFVTSLSLGFISCSDDDDADTEDYAKAIAGTYKGDVSFLGQAIPNAEIELTRIAENKVQLKMDQNLLIQVVKVETTSDVTLQNGKYTINATATHPMEGFSLPIGIKGTVDKNNKMNLTIVVGQGITDIPPFPVDVVFDGERQ